MKKWLVVALLFTTGCAGVQLKNPVPVAKYTTPHVFFAYGPNGVGYQTVIDTTLDDSAIVPGSIVSCEVMVLREEGPGTQLLEGRLWDAKDPILLEVNTIRGLEVFAIPYGAISFCLTYDQNKPEN